MSKRLNELLEKQFLSLEEMEELELMSEVIEQCIKFQKLMVDSLYEKGSEIMNKGNDVEMSIIKEVILDYNVDKITITKQSDKVLIRINGDSHYYEGELTIDGTLIYKFNN